MSKKKVLIFLGLVLLMSGAALAQQDYSTGMLSTSNLGHVYHRMYHPQLDLVSFSGEGNCTPGADFVGFDLTNRTCESVFKTPKSGPSGYKGYIDGSANDGKPLTDVRYAVWDNEQNPGATNHAGYYFFAGKALTQDETMFWNAVDCGAGATPATCLGQGNDSNAAGTNLTNVPRTPAHLTGFRPIPVPYCPTTPNKVTGDIPLQWLAAGAVNTTATVTYDLFGVAKASCTEPLASEYNKSLGNITGTSTTVNVSAFGNTPSTVACYYFAIKLHYPNAGATTVTSLYLSSNSAGVAFNQSAATVTNIKAVRAGNAISVSWNTSLEDGLKGFYVMRSFTENGTYERVSGLIAAKGQPSSYTFVDTKAPMGQVRGTGVYYKIQTSDIDNNVQAYGPVKADLGMGQGPVQREQRQQIRENKTQRTR